MGIMEKIFGSYSKREVKKILPLVDKIESLEELEKTENLKNKFNYIKNRFYFSKLFKFT